MQGSCGLSDLEDQPLSFIFVLSLFLEVLEDSQRLDLQALLCG